MFENNIFITDGLDPSQKQDLMLIRKSSWGYPQKIVPIILHSPDDWKVYLGPYNWGDLSTFLSLHGNEYKIIERPIGLTPREYEAFSLGVLGMKPGFKPQVFDDYDEAVMIRGDYRQSHNFPASYYCMMREGKTLYIQRSNNTRLIWSYDTNDDIEERWRLFYKGLFTVEEWNLRRSIYEGYPRIR